MSGRTGSVAWLLSHVLIIGMLIGQGPAAGLIGLAPNVALAAKQHQSAAVATPDAAQPFIVCKAPGGTTLRPVDSAKDCRGNEHPANLNNGQRPLGVCVQTSDGLLRLTRTTPGGSRPADCDNKAENWRQAPGDAPTNLCLGPDGNLRLCPDGAKPDFIVPAGTNATKNQATKNRPAENRPPKAVDDKGDGFTTDAAIPFTTGNVLANDRDPEGGALTVVQVKTATTKGKVTDYGDGTFGYDPNGQFDHLAPGKSATDRFTYTIADDHHQRATATVSITITGAASGPTTANPALEPAVATQTPPTGGSAVKPSAVEIWACKQGPGYLRAVSAKTDCKKNETAVNLNNRDHPLGVCVQNTSQLLQVKGPLKSGGSKPRDCKPATSTFLQLPGDSPTKLCVRLDGLLILCANSPNPDITVPALNASPVANDDSGAGFGTNEDTAFTTGDVLANDTDPDGDPLSVSALDKTGTKGKVTSNNDGAFAYDPNGKFDALPAGGNGSDSFAYTVSDGHGGTDTATVTIAITGVNDPPNAVNDTATTDKLTATTVNLLANDTDPDNGDVLSVSSIDTTGTKGKVTDNGDGAVGYDPNGKFNSLGPGQTATDTFGYTVSDGNGGTDTATVQVTVQGVNRPPVAADDSGAGFGTNEDTAFTTGNVLTNDTDPDGDPLSITALDKTGTTGKVTSNNDGAFNYDPNGQFESLGVGESATDTFGYTVGDGNGGTATAMVTIAIAGVNDPPAAVNDTATTDERTATTINLLANDTDPDASDTLSVSAIDTTGTKGKVTDNHDGTVGYDPNGQFDSLQDGQSASDTFGYTVSDGHGGSDTATVTVTITGISNQPPVANDDSGAGFGTDEDTAFTTDNVLANDTDPDGDTLSVSALDTTGTSGTVTDNHDGTFHYDPNGAFDALPAGGDGSDTFHYTVSDGHGGADTGTVTIAITGVNDAPVLAAIESGALAYTEGDGPTAITSTLTVSDPDSATITGATVKIATNFTSGQDVLAFTNTATITGSFDSNSGILTLSGNDTKANYQAALRAVTYENTSNAPSTATRTIAFQVNDGAAANNLSNVATRDVTVASVNSAPVLAGIESGALAYTEGDGAKAITGTLIVADADSATLSGATAQITGNYQNGEDVLAFTNANGITGSFAPATGTLTLSGAASVANYQAALRAVTYANTSNNPSTATRTITVQVDDGAAANHLSNTVTRDIAVTAVNTAPVLANIEGAALSFTEGDAAKAITSALTVSDPDSATLTGATVTISAGYQNGQDVLAFTNGNGITGAFTAATGTLALSGTASPGAYQAALRSVTFANASENPSTTTRTISFQVDDGAAANHLSNTATRTIAVTAVNDAPVNAVPGAQTANEDTDLTFNSANGNAISIADVDAGGSSVKLSLDVAHGTLTLPSTNGLTFVDATANGQAAVHVTGTLANINADLNGLKYRGTSNFNTSRGTETLTVVTNDQGNAGSGGAQSDTDAVGITVAAVNDAPTAQNKTGGAAYAAETNMKISIAAGSGLTQGASDPDTGDGGYTASFTVGSVNGVAPSGGTITTTIAGVGAVTVNASTGAFDFDPAPGVTGAVSFPYTVCDSGNPTPSQCSAAATVAFNISGPVIWFVNPAAGSNGAGTLASPFNVLSAADAVDAASHRIFVYSGTATSGIALNSGEWLVGQGVTGSASFDALMGITPPSGTIARPAIATGTATVQGTVTLNTNAVVKALSLSTTTGAGMNDPAGAITGVSVDQVAVTTTTGTGVSLSDIAGTLNFTGLATNGGTGASLTGSNGSATFGFTGVSVSSGANNGFVATGGGTVNVTGSANTLASTTGAALNVANTTIGASGVTFKSIAANGAASGIVLNNTGTTGGLTVTGTGAANSGGTIQNTTSHGILLTSTKNASFNNMNIQNTGGSGVRGTTAVTNFTFTNGTINNSGTGGGNQESSIAFNDPTGSATDAKITGAVTITGNTLTNALWHGVSILQFAGALTDVNISNNVLTSGTTTGAGGNSFGSGIQLFADGNGTTASTVTRAELNNNTITNFPGGVLIAVQCGTANSAGPTADCGTPGSATNDVEIKNNTLNGGGTTPDGAGGFIKPNQIMLLTVNGRGQGQFTVQNNGTVADPLSGSIGNIIDISAGGSVTVQATVTGNQIDAAGQTVSGTSGIAAGVGPFTVTGPTTLSTATLYATVQNNVVRNSAGTGVRLNVNAGDPTLNAIVTGNDIGAPISATYGIQVVEGNNAGFTGNVNLQISGNKSAGGTGGGNTFPGIGLRKFGTASGEFNILNLTPSPATNAQMESYVSGQNPNSASGTFGTGGTAAVNGSSNNWMSIASVPQPPPLP